MTTAHLPVADPGTAWRHAKRQLLGDRRSSLLVLSVYAAATVFAVLPSWILGELIETHETATTGTLALWSAFAAACVLVQGAFTLLSRIVATRWSERTMRDMRDRFVDDVLHLDPRALDKATTGDVSSRATVDVSMVSEAMRNNFPELVICAVTVVVVSTVLLIVNPLMAAAILLGLACTLPGARHVFGRNLKAHLDEHAARAEAADKTAENIQGADVVDAFGLKGKRDGIVRSVMSGMWATGRRIMFLDGVLFTSIDVGKSVTLLGGIVLAAVSYQAGLADLGASVTGLLLLRILSEPVANLVIHVQETFSAAASYSRLIGLAEARLSDEGSTEDAPTPGTIELKEVSFSYNGRRDALHDVSLSIASSEKVAIVGVSGSGKTTLARLITGSIRATHGDAHISGLDVAGLPAVRQRSLAVLVKQESHVFLATVRDNVALARPDAPDDELTEILNEVGAGDWLDSLPEGLDTVLEEGADHVDDVVAQRIALARVLVAPADVLVLDEATALLPGQDADRADTVVAMRSAHKTVVTIAHRLTSARTADRVIVMDHGAIVETGTHDTLLAADGHYAEMWRMWSGGAVAGEQAAAGRIG